MKKVIYHTLLLAFLGVLSCKSNNSTNENKIDFTQSYENAALALSSAQINYKTALASNDTAKIDSARRQLEAATNNYVNSKNSLVKHSGVVKQEYESSLTQSKQALS